LANAIVGTLPIRSAIAQCLFRPGPRRAGLPIDSQDLREVDDRVAEQEAEVHAGRDEHFERTACLVDLADGGAGDRQVGLDHS
jgi:hypothetical protein